MFHLRRFKVAVVFIMIFALAPTVAAAESVRIIVDGVELGDDAQAEVIDGTVYVPATLLARLLGASVRLDEANNSLYVQAESASLDAIDVHISIPAHLVSNSVGIDIRLDGTGEAVRVIRPAAAGAAAAPEVRIDPVAAESSADRAQAAPEAQASAEPEEVAAAGGPTVIPNRYNQHFEVAEDELFIMVANYKPFEIPGVFERLIGEPLRRKFPDVKFKLVVWDYPIRYDDLEAIGFAPDIVIENSRTGIDRDLRPRGWTYDMSDLIAQNGLDLASLNQAAVEMVKARSDGGMYGIPFMIDEFIMFYNRGLFDRFGEPYPQSGMTYDEAYELALSMTRQVGPVSYKGYMQHADHYLWYNQLGLQPFSWDERDKAEFTSDEWYNLVENMRRFPSIQGNIFTTTDEFPQGRIAIVVDNMYKMMVYAGAREFISPSDLGHWLNLAENLDFDIAAVPVLPEAPNSIYQPNLLSLFLTPQSQKKELAFEVIQYMVSEEMQVELAKNGIKGVLNSPALAENFGANIPEIADKDLSAVFWGENAVPKYNPETFKFWNIPLWYVFRQYVYKEDKPSEFALQLAEDESNNYIRSRKAAGFDH